MNDLEQLRELHKQQMDNLKAKHHREMIELRKRQEQEKYNLRMKKFVNEIKEYIPPFTLSCNSFVDA